MAPERKRGRPALSTSGPSARVCVKMPPELYDRVYQLAIQRRTNVPDVLRRAATRAVRADDPDRF